MGRLLRPKGACQILAAVIGFCLDYKAIFKGKSHNCCLRNMVPPCGVLQLVVVRFPLITGRQLRDYHSAVVGFSLEYRPVI